MAMLWLYLFEFALLLNISRCFVIKFSASPNAIKANLTAGVSMRCSLADTEDTSIGRRSTITTNTSSDVTRIMSFTIRRNDGQEVAFATPFDPPTTKVDLGNLEVKGDVSGSSSEGFVELTWRDASNVALGEYTCEVATIESGHRTLLFTSTLELTSVNATVSDLLTEFHAMKQDVFNLQQENQGLKKDVSSLQQVNQRLSRTVGRLSTCVSDGVSFMAILSHEGQNQIPVSANQTVVFDKVVTNQGGAYNSKTGQFMCKNSGIYEFNAHAAIYGGNYAILHLNINSSPVTSLNAQDSAHADSGSAGAVVYLKIGDKVDVTVAGYNASFFQDVNIWQSNVFAGHLVHSDECMVSS